VFGSSVHNTHPPPPFRAPNDFFRYTTEGILNLAAQYATNKEATRPLPILGGKETTPDSSKAVPSSIIIQGVMKDVKGSKKRWAWCP
jgi:hypothetical protein